MTDRVGQHDAPEDAGHFQMIEGWGGKHELALLRSAIRAIGEAIIVTGPELDQPGPLIEYVNPGFEHMTGYAAHEVVGRSPRFLQGPNTDRAVLDRLRMALRAGQSIRDETVNYRKDGTEYVVEWLITPVLDESRIVHWVAAQRDVTERKRAEERQALLSREVDHRAKNALAVVQSALRLTKAPDVPSYVRTIEGRVGALARAQTLLADDRWASADLRTLLEGELAAFLDGGTAGQRAILEGPIVALPAGAAQPLAMALHELATNAVKYGALSAPTGRVSISWQLEGGSTETLRLRWVEAGGPPVVGSPVRRGFGSRVLDRTVRGQLGGTVSLAWKVAGLVCDIEVPLLRRP